MRPNFFLMSADHSKFAEKEFLLNEVSGNRLGIMLFNIFALFEKIYIARFKRYGIHIYIKKSIVFILRFGYRLYPVRNLPKYIFTP